MGDGGGGNMKNAQNHKSGAVMGTFKRRHEITEAGRARTRVARTGRVPLNGLGMTMCSQPVNNGKSMQAEQRGMKARYALGADKENRVDDVFKARGTGKAGRELGHLPPTPPRTTALLTEGIERGVYLQGGAPAPKPAPPHAAAEPVTTRRSTVVANTWHGLDLAPNGILSATSRVTEPNTITPIPPLITATREGGITSGAHLQEGA